MFRTRVVMTSHPLYIELRKKYGLSLKKRKYVEESVTSEEEEDDFEDEEDSVEHQGNNRSSV